jgi:hypothetical protein
MPSIVVPLSDFVTFIVESPSKILIKVRIEEKVYSLNVANLSRKHLYRPTSDTIAAEVFDEPNRLRTETSSLLDKMKAVIVTCSALIEKKNEMVCPPSVSIWP